MRTITNTTLYKSAALPANIQPPLTDDERHIFEFINNVCEAIPVMSNGEYGVVTARLAGGWVRDKIMPMVRTDVPVKPPKDLDFTVDIMGGDLFGDFMALYDRINRTSTYTPGANTDPTAQKVGVSHGKINVGGTGYEIEITQLRKEGYDTEGDRKSVHVESGSLEEDTYRRDLTINAMYYNIKTGRVEDVTGQGYDDLATLTLRTPSRPGADPSAEVDRIFTEDPVRVLRVIRFFSRWPNAQIDPVILQKLADPKIHDLISRKLRDSNLTKHDPGVSAEGLANELRKIMMGEQPAEAMEVLLKTGLMPEILGLPEDFHHLQMDQRNKYHELTVIEHTLEVLRNTNRFAKEFDLDDKERMMLNFGTWFHDIGKLDPRAQKTKDPDAEGNVYIGYYGNPEHPESMRHEESSQQAWLRFANILRMTNEEIPAVSSIILNHMIPHDHVDEGAKRSELGEFKDKNPLWKSIYIHAMGDASSKRKTPDFSRAEPYKVVMNTIENIQLPPIAQGNEIMKMTRLKPGPVIGDLLKATRKQQYKNLDLPQPLSPEEEKQQLVQVLFNAKDKAGETIIPEVSNRDTIRQYLQERAGIVPGRPPQGMPGVLQFIKNKVIQERNRRAIGGEPTMTDADIEQLMQESISSGELDSYRQV